MKTANGFTAMNISEFAEFIKKLQVSRKITRIQIHHTWQPGYAEWNKKPDALYWQKAMRDYHVNGNGWADIAQQLTICPDGTIVTGRSFNKSPAGITGANTGAVCIENLGNFDNGKDNMTSAQAEAIIAVVALLLKRFRLDTSAITYHAWWTASGGYLGTYVSSKSAKSCPGTNFFGGNTKEAFEKGFKIRVQNYINGKTEELTMAQYEELKKIIVQQDRVIQTLAEAVEKNTPMIYNYIDENMPEWARPTIQKLKDKGLLKGNEHGELGLTYSEIHQYVINDRAGLYD